MTLQEFILMDWWTIYAFGYIVGTVVTYTLMRAPWNRK